MPIYESKRFKNRETAAKELILELSPSMLLEDWYVLATSYGGLPLAKYISGELGYKYDIIFSKKIYSSVNNECEIAIVTETNEVVIHEELLESFEIDIDEIFDEAKQKYENDIMSDIIKFRGARQLSFMDKNILLVDEGLNTGLTMMACIKSAIILGAKSVCIATPVLPTVTTRDMETRADEVYFVKEVDHFIDIAFYYEDLKDISKSDIIKYFNND